MTMNRLRRWWRPVLLLAHIVWLAPHTVCAQMPTAEACGANLAKLDLPQARSLIGNGDFEKGGSGWQFNVWPCPKGFDPGKNSGVARGIAHSGQHALRFDSAGVPAGAKALTAYQQTSTAGAGQRIRVSFWSFLQTAPHADFDPVKLTVRQYREAGLAKWSDFEVFNDTGEWTYGEKTVDVIDDLKSMNILLTVGNTSDNKPAVLFVDDVRCETIGVQPLAARLPTSELPVADRFLPVCVTVAQEVLDKTACRLDAVLTRQKSDSVLKRCSRAVAVAGDRWALDLTGAPPGPYEVRLFLSANGAGPVARVDLPFLVYEGPFAQNGGTK
ncbi:MAG: hypothetical protein JXR37_25455 [Kiritimatiellae bacterium]|nr:hypothetical protein [Kiritimatiellia bacterium]